MKLKVADGDTIAAKGKTEKEKEREEEEALLSARADGAAASKRRVTT